MNRYGALDRFRLIAAFLVVANHISPLAGQSEIADFILTRAAARLAVPFFLMVTGFFVLPEYVYDRSRNYAKVAVSLKKTGLLYFVSVLLYLPIGLYAGHYRGLTLGRVLKMLFFDGTFYHLWYLPAAMLSLIFVCLMARLLPPKGMFAISVFLYIIGLGGDSYYGLIQATPLAELYGVIFMFTSYTRIFQAPIFLIMGAAASRSKPIKRPLPIFIDMFAALVAEALVLRSLEIQRHDSMYIFLPLCLWFLFKMLSGVDAGPAPCLRPASMIIYIVHPAVIAAVRLAAKLTGMKVLTENGLVLYAAVCFLSGLIALLWVKTVKVAEPLPRAYIQLDREALAHNVEFLRSKLPDGCVLMPVIKADAYGHGAVFVAKELNRLGVRAFAVATADEGAQLRDAGVRGDILILGCTPLRQIGIVRKKRLIQTVTDLRYAYGLNSAGGKVRVHLAVNTGMNRLGVDPEKEDVFSVFKLKNLRVEGVFTHLCADDGSDSISKRFTFEQAEKFAAFTDELDRRGYRVKKHLLNSYGLFSYPELGGDYARVGIALYGVLSDGSSTAELAPLLRPVLSFKAEIAQVRTVLPGENIGYGLKYTAEREMRVAVVAAGYADGIPRSLSGKGEVLINGRRAPIIGMICMDQLMADITGIEAEAGDTATVIGRDGGEEITVCELADRCGTITNEILSRLGQRPKRLLK